jgi:hypothetical protein
LFRMLDDTRSRLLRWKASAEKIEFLGEHFGYCRSPLPPGLPGPIRVRREVRLDSASNSVVIVDRLDSEIARASKGGTARSASVPVEWSFPVAPELSPVELTAPAAQRVPADLPEPDQFCTHLAGCELPLIEVGSVRLGPMILHVLIPRESNFVVTLDSTVVAPRFGQRIPAPLVRISGISRVPVTCAFRLCPVGPRA